MMRGRSILLLVLIAALSAARPAAAQADKAAAPDKDKKPTAASTDKAKSKTPPRSPSEEVPPPSTAAATAEKPSPAATEKQTEVIDKRDYDRLVLVAGLSIFVLAIFVGFEVISKVPATLHTPLMSGSNAISGITVVGAVIAAAAGWGFSSFLGFFAVILAMVNVVGGFLVTHRMLLMFKRK